VGQNVYRTAKLDVFKQDKLVRRLAPMLVALPGALRSLKDENFAAIADVLQRLSDEDVRVVQELCLGVVSRRQAETLWVPVMSNGGLMFDDVTLLELYTIVVNVVRENLAGFFAVIAQKGSEFAKQAG